MVVKGRGNYPDPQDAPRPSPVTAIANIGSLKRFPDRRAARDMLHDIAMMVAPVIHEYGFKVGTLCEMYPKSPNLLGLNVNHGQKILLRLRFASNERLFLPLADIVETFLHELTHNVHGPHDDKFYKLLDELRLSYERRGASGTGDYRCEQNRLGGRSLASMRDQRLKKYGLVKETRRLGAATTGVKCAPLTPNELRLKRLQAIERRARDNKLCHPEEIDDDDVEIVAVSSIPGEGNSFTIKMESTNPSPSKYHQEVIDVDADDDTPAIEIITVDACEKKKVTFDLPEFKEAKEYTTSAPGKTFFDPNQKYPRRKMVVQMDFDTILRTLPVAPVTESPPLAKGQPKKRKAPRRPRKKKKTVKTVSTDDMIKFGAAKQ